MSSNKVLRIREDLQIGKRYGLICTDNNMVDLKGKEAIILKTKSIKAANKNYNLALINLDGCSYWWDSSMFTQA